MPNEPTITVTGRKLTFNEATRRLNPHLFGLAAMESSKPQPNQVRTLERGPSPNKTSRRSIPSRPYIRVTLISCRSRLCDRDNIIAGFKPLRDAIARFFNLDDSERFIEWEYSQIETRGGQGTVVRVEML